MKDLIIGAYDNYDYETLQYWINSIKQSGFNGDIVCIAHNTSFDTVDKLVSKGVHVSVDKKNENERRFEHSSPLPIHVERFFNFYNILDSFSYRYRYVITTDMKDIVFQTNPSEWLETNLVEKILVSSECLAYKDEPWGDENFQQTFGPFFYNRFKNNKIYNVGLIAGDADYMRDFCLNIFNMSVNRPIQIVDQAVFNMLIYTRPYMDVVQYADMEDGWASHLGTVMDPRKINKFRPHLTEEEPVLDNGVLKTHRGEEFCVIHQWDRVPEMQNIVKEKYGEKINE